MKTILIIFGVAMIATVFGNELSACKCGETLEAKKDNEGNIKCFGIHTRIVVPCNLVYRPRCACTGPVTGIVNDKTGTYCSQALNGVQIKRWDCENKEDWDKFFQEHPNEKKQ